VVLLPPAARNCDGGWKNDLQSSSAVAPASEDKEEDSAEEDEDEEKRRPSSGSLPQEARILRKRAEKKDRRVRRDPREGTEEREGDDAETSNAFEPQKGKTACTLVVAFARVDPSVEEPLVETASASITVALSSLCCTFLSLWLPSRPNSSTRILFSKDSSYTAP
jgi:hypothetical protein